MEPILAPLDGTLPTISDIADFHAKHNGNLPWLVFPSKDKPDAQCSLSFTEVVEASHRVSHLLRPGREGPEREVVAMLLNTDTMLYIAVLLGLLRAGFVPYPMSPRNSPQGVAHMLEATKCTRILTQDSVMPLINQVQSDLAQKGFTLRVDNLPALHVVFPQLGYAKGSPEGVKPYPPSNEPADVLATTMYIHSSGSTGFPKSIHFTHARLLQWVKRTPIGNKHSVRFGAAGLPLFHVMGLIVHLIYPLATVSEISVYPPQYPAPPIVPNPQNAYEIAKLTGCTALVSPPSFVEAWSRSPEIIELLKTLKVLVYGGGPLSLAVGNRLVEAGVPLNNGYGATEFGSPALPWDEISRTSTKPDPDWYWYRMTDTKHTRFEPQGDGTYEMVLMEDDDYHLPVHNVPGEKAYATRDLFEPHPSKSHLWKIVGRKDDVITLSIGEKIVPIPQEGQVNSSPYVVASVMFGREREQPGILVEPFPGHEIDPNDTVQLSNFRNKIWPHVEEANAIAPGYAKIFKEMILVTHPNKPLPRAGKGTILRKQALAIYNEEIEKLYETVAESTNNQGIQPPQSWSSEDLEPWLLEHAASLVTHRDEFSRSVDVFQQGFDSLSATFFRNRIIGSLRASENPALQEAAKNVSANIIFENPTIRQLANALKTIVDPSQSQSAEYQLRAKVEDINAMIAKYTQGMPAARATAKATEGAPVVLLTGSTGNIGSHILAYLLSDSRVGRVYTLNRPSADPIGRIKTAFSDRGLPVNVLGDSRFVSLVGDIMKDQFGLDAERYSEILRSVTHIIHNAWTVNFNLALQSFEDQIAGVRKLIDISAASEHPMRLLITSSIGVANAWDQAKGAVPEAPLTDPSTAANIGYGASKYVVEQLLAAAKKNGISATAVRMGQACGPKGTGAWGVTEWMPILIKSSVALGCLPAMTGPVDWVPLDAIGEAYIDWVVAQGDLPLLMNVVHPRPTTWDVILRGVREELGGTVPIVPLEEWVAKLKAHAANPSPETLNRIPALKLMDFFSGLSQHFNAGEGHAAAPTEVGALDNTFETTKLCESSPTMRAIQPLSEEHAKMWVKYWKGKGFITLE